MSEKIVLGISSSPRPNSNTDRAVKAVLKATGMKTEFIKLSDYTVAPCRYCYGCVNTNRCVQNDDGIMLAEKVKNADALVIGAFTPYSSLDARAKALLERLWPNRHLHGYMRNKPGGVVITSAVPDIEIPLPVHPVDMGINAVKYYMMGEGMNFVGDVRILGNTPCIGCGNGDTCVMSAFKVLDPKATVESVGVNLFEKQPIAIKAAEELGKNIAQALSKQPKTIKTSEEIIKNFVQASNKEEKWNA